MGIEESDGLTQCHECGRVFVSKPGKDMCAVCTARLFEQRELVDLAVEKGRGETIDDIAEFTGLSSTEARRVVNDNPALGASVADEEVCVKCGGVEAQKGSDFCLVCRLELHKSFGDATDELFTQIAYPPAPTVRETSLGGLLSTLGEKRLRASVGRINPAPRRFKY